MKTLILILATLSTTAMADAVGTATGKIDEGGKKDGGAFSAAQKTATEYGDDYLQTASSDKALSQVSRDKKRRSWRKTQILLKAMNKMRCRVGGSDAKTIAILALANEGYCNQKAEITGTTKLPPGTVWVYNNEPHGNTVVKIKDNVYYSNRKMSAPPPDHGNLAAIMVPGCGKKAKKCQSADKLMAELEKLEKASDDAKAARAEKGDRSQEFETGSAKSKDASEADSGKLEQMGISEELKNAEFSCKIDRATGDPDSYFACVEAIMGDR